MENKKNYIVGLTTKNEEECIAYMIDSLRAIGLNDIFVVDEHSEDKTVEIANNRGIETYQRDGDGLGYGIRKALEIAEQKGYEYVIFPDCDGTYPPDQLPELIKHIPEYDMIVGVREFEKVRALHRLPNKIHTLTLNLLYGGKLSDINSGMRIVNIPKYKPKMTATDWDITAQFGIVSLKNKFKVKEVPINYKKRVGGESKINIKAGFTILWRIIKDRFTK